MCLHIYLFLCLKEYEEELYVVVKNTFVIEEPEKKYLVSDVVYVYFALCIMNVLKVLSYDLNQRNENASSCMLETKAQGKRISFA